MFIKYKRFWIPILMVLVSALGLLNANLNNEFDSDSWEDDVTALLQLADNQQNITLILQIHKATNNFLHLGSSQNDSITPIAIMIHQKTDDEGFVKLDKTEEHPSI